MSEPTPVGYTGHIPGVSVTDFPSDLVQPVDMRIDVPPGNLGAAPARPGGEVEVAPRLFLGDWEDAQSWDGETLNLNDEASYDKQTFKVNMLIPKPPGHAGSLCVSRARLDEAADIIEQRLRLGDKRLLVHCLVGMERSPLAIAWWMVKTSKQPNLQAALAHIKTVRPIIEDRSDWVEAEPPAPVDMRIEIPHGVDSFQSAPSAVGELPAEASVRLTAEASEPATAGAELTEQQKYEAMWSHEQYRTVAPGESIAPVFLGVAKPKPGSTIIDFGAGTGRGALMIALLGSETGLQVEMLDFAANSLDEDVRNALETQAHVLRFTQHDLTKPIPKTAQYGYCTDVMEHIPPDWVDTVLYNVLKAAQHVFFQISCTDDSCGVLIGHPLHLSVHPFEWWLKKLQAFDCVVHWSEDRGHSCLFYVSAWRTGDDVCEIGEINVGEETILANVRTNLELNLTEVMPHGTNEIEVMIVAGGPSLVQYEAEIRQRREAGMPLITLNGAYNWALERGLKPSAQIVVDAQPQNARFTRPLSDGCKYLIASQVDPGVLEGLPPERTLMWHTSMDSIRAVVDEKRKWWYQIPGGSTVLLRAIPLMRMLGYQKFHIYGADSCWLDDKHHAYEQQWDGGGLVIPVTCGDQIFRCSSEHIAQAQQFMTLIQVYGDVVELNVYGPGLLAHILRTGAELADDLAPEADDFSLS